jgi:hypothetical protein
MIFVIRTDDEVAGLDIAAALNNAGISHTIISKICDEAAQHGMKSDVCHVCHGEGVVTENGRLRTCVFC